MFKIHISVAVAAALALSASSALAANNTASITIKQGNVTLVDENLSGLLVEDTNPNDFKLLSGAGTSGIFQKGDFVVGGKNGIDTTHPDYWKWNNGGWDMLSSSDDTLMLRLNSASGHGDPDLSLGLYAYNSSGNAQTYSFNVSSSIYPLVSSAYTASATLTSVTFAGSPTISATQTFNLFDAGNVAFNPGVNVSASTFGTSSAFAPQLGNVDTFNTMKLSTEFTLSGGSASNPNVALVTSFASITPVPEPESYAMMLSGIALLAGMARRRKI